jgi:MFS family permease
VTRTARVREVFATPNFVRLYGTRLLSATADGIFQAGLASFVFFSPEKATTPGKTAAAFAALLLPYSILGPFVGVFLDRWRRQRVLVVGNIVKVVLVLVVAALVLADSAGAVFFAIVVCAFGVNRLFLAALSAALPRLIDDDHLVTANALSTTSGSVATIVGVGIGGAIRVGAGSTPSADAAIVALAALVYGMSATVAAMMGRDLLGPDLATSSDVDRRAQSSSPRVSPWRAATTIVSELVAATRYVASRGRAARALAAISAHRFLFGVASLTIVLLDRNYFASPANPNGGIFGLGAAIGAVGVGIVLAAVITPPATDRVGTTAWITVMLLLAGVAIAAGGLPFRQVPLIVGAFALGLSAQSVKICVDTTVQEEINDRYRGRLFAVYDMLFNVTYVGAAAAAATLLPASGKSVPVMASVAAGYVLAAVIFRWRSRMRPQVIEDQKVSSAAPVRS